ncbi:DNA adenine methylase [Faecalispora jeddahensis]|nr:DNA adenine methylase [Faecalispora jeddahensis]
MQQIRSVIKYPGSKWRIADWIINHMAEHRSYLEPYLGSGGVFF